MAAYSGVTARTGTKGNIVENPLPASGPGSQTYVPGTSIPTGIPYQQGPAPTYPQPTAPTMPMTTSAPEVPSSPGTGSISLPSGPFIPEPGTPPIDTKGGTPGTGGVASTDALNKVTIPSIDNLTSSFSQAAGAISGGGGAMGNQEGNATASMSGLLRALGQHNPPEQSLKLQRKAY